MDTIGVNVAFKIDIKKKHYKIHFAFLDLPNNYFYVFRLEIIKLREECRRTKLGSQKLTKNNNVT